MLGKQNSGSSKDLIFLTPKGKKGGKEIDPVFEVRRKVEGNYKDVESVTDFSGNLVKVEHKVATPQAPAKPFDLIAYTIDAPDSDERYIVEFTFKNSTRSFFNRTLGLESFENVEIGTFRNDAGFETLTIKQDGKPVKAKYAKEDVPEVEVTVKKSGDVDKDYFEVNKFFKEKMIEFGAKLAGTPKTESAEAPKAKAGKKEKVAAGSDYKNVGLDDEEAPF